MIRRLGDSLEMTPGCVQYQDLNTGQWISDPSSPACGAGTLPDDPEGAGAVQEFAASTSAASSNAALNASAPPASLVLAQSLMSGNIPSPLPGLGLTVPLPNIPNLTNYLIIAAVAIAALFMITESQSSPSRRSR